MHDYGDQRRVPGLRREEVAQLAGVSLGYYTRLEQGAHSFASNAVLDAVAQVLRLNDEEWSHLHRLAAPPWKARRELEPERMRPDIVRLIDCFGRTPALVMGRSADVLHWNRTAHALLGGHLPFEEPGRPGGVPNLARLVFLDRQSRELYADWARKSYDVVAYLRIAAARWPADDQLTKLIGELCIGSREFSELWATHPIRACAYDTREYRHPLVGPMVLRDEVMDLPDDDGQRIAVFYAEPGTPSASALELLGQIAAER